ncbi:putative protein [Vanrija pseudolonga]|uniref:Purtative protein n=1 Tax=Vanrija pseudolonga TaxID=143232 RepID=A0AAF0Y4K2_9TREE|nr:purtative protein [Vanrija pseudolonga]
MPAYKNNYKSEPLPPPPFECHLHTPVEDYDLNFVLPVTELRSDRVELRPLIPSLHAQPLLDGVLANPELLLWLGVTREWSTLDDVCDWIETVCRRDKTHLHYAIYSAPLDRLDAPVEEYQFAGTAALMEADPSTMIIEIGWLIILGPFQRTHVLTHTSGLMMHRSLDTPEQGGLGFRRLQWKANSLNQKSQAAALRLGYKFEGIVRAFVVLPKGKKGVRAGRPGVPNADREQRDTWMGSITWFEWEEGVNAHVDKLVARRD